MITGITLIKNANLLKYPWKLNIISMLSCCEMVIVNVDPTSEDNTLEELRSIAKYYPIQIVESVWDMKNTGDGRELAIQANKLLPHVRSNWVLYLQADELVHEGDARFINNLTDNISSDVSQIEFYRTYFWETIFQRYTPNELYLGRLFRTGTHEIGGDGMHLVRHSGEVYRSSFLIYHYSRMGTEEEVTRRIRTLDGLFHEKDQVQKFTPFRYDSIDPANLIKYYNSHPKGVRELYGE